MKNQDLFTAAFDKLVRFLREEWRIETYWTKDRIWFDIEQWVTSQQPTMAVHNADQLSVVRIPDAMKDVMRALFRMNWIYIDTTSPSHIAGQCDCDDGDCQTCYPITTSSVSYADEARNRNVE